MPDETENLPNTQPAAPDGPIVWTAAEFIAHKKTSRWYGLLALATVVLAGLIFLITRDIISTVVVVLSLLVLGFYAGREPKDLQYQLDANGIRIGNKYHSFEEFRSFAVVPEGHLDSIIFSPLRRFAPLTTIYYKPDDEQAIVSLLADRLPIEEHHHDAIERLMSRIHF